MVVPGSQSSECSSSSSVSKNLDRVLPMPRQQCLFFFSSRRRHPRFSRDWSSDVCSSDLPCAHRAAARRARRVDRTPRAAPARGRRDAAHRHARGTRGRRRRGAARDRTARRDAVASVRSTRHLVARRIGHGLDVIPLVERYRDRLPLAPGDPIVSLYEGSTPLVHADALSAELGIDLWLKLESMNPTGSFKDRGLTVAVSRALAQGATGVVCASTGNTAASAAAYAARAGLSAEILLPQGAVALGKLAQARAVGARLVEVRGSFDQALRGAQALGDSGRYVLVNSLNPDRIEGQKTAAFEIAEELDRVPDVLALPYGGGGNTRAYARGFTEWDAGMPRFLAGEAARRGETLASAIRIVDPAHRAEAEAAVRASGGVVVALTDDEIVGAWRLLAEQEGIFCEPASAAGLAAVQKLGASGTVVVVVTGYGLKDPDAVDRIAEPIVEVDVDAIADVFA